MKKKSLRIKITCIVGIIVTLACVALTANSILSANHYYPDPAEIQMDQEGMKTSDAKDFIEIDEAYDYQASKSAFSYQNLAVMAVTVLLSILITYFVTGKVLKPLTDLANTAENIDEENLHQRVATDGASWEIQVLADSMDHMLERLDKSFQVQKMFASNAAHEFKTPLAGMKSSLQVLRLDDQPNAQDYEDFAKDVEICVDRLNHTVNGLLMLASDSEEKNQMVFQLKELLVQVVTDLSPFILKKNIQIDVKGKPREIKGDAALLYRAFYNLIENAVKYSFDQGQIEITLSDEDPFYVEIRDHGTGMTTDEAEHIFEPFYRADRSRSQKIPGCGLGLSIVKLIMDKCGGIIQVESEKNHGTSIRVFI